MMDNFLKDIRYAVRVSPRRGHDRSCSVTLALAIGATTAISAWVYGVLLRPLPYPNPDQIVALFEVSYLIFGHFNIISPIFFPNISIPISDQPTLLIYIPLFLPKIFDLNLTEISLSVSSLFAAYNKILFFRVG